jgi:hypothetical protein
MLAGVPLPPRGPVLALGLAVVGCAAQEPAGPAPIELRLEDKDCTPEDYARVYALSVAVYGQQGPNVNDYCLDAPRCLFAPPLAGLEDVVAVLQDEPQPLVEADAEGAVRVALHGHERGCFGYSAPDDPPPVMCGFADLASASDGGLEILLGCSACDAPPRELCE